MSTARSLVIFSGCLNAIRLIIEISFGTCGDGVGLWFRLGGLWNGRFLLFNAEGVGTLRPPLSHLEGLCLLNGGGEFG